MKEQPLPLSALESELHRLLQTTSWHTDEGAYLQSEILQVLVSTWDTSDPAQVHLTLTVTSAQHDVSELAGVPLLVRPRRQEETHYVGRLSARGSLFLSAVARGAYEVLVLGRSSGSRLPAALAQWPIVLFPEQRSTAKGMAAASHPGPNEPSDTRWTTYELADHPVRLGCGLEGDGTSVIVASSEDAGLDGAIALCAIHEPTDNARMVLMPLTWRSTRRLCEARVSLPAEMLPFRPGLLEGLVRPEDLVAEMTLQIQDSIRLAQSLTRVAWENIAKRPSMIPVIREVITGALGAAA